MNLKELQDTFQNAILADDSASVLDHINDSNKEKRDVLFGVYSNAYVARLIEFLMNDYEKLHEYLGDEQFFEMARRYIAANPSHNPNGRWFGSKLPDFLSETEPYSGMPLLHELAAFERALNDVFDATDADVLSLEMLAGLAPEDWPKLQLLPHPSVIRLNFVSNATSIWIALNNEEEVPDSCEYEEPEQIIVYRHERTSTFRVMEYAEAMMWDQAVKGINFGLLCEMMGTYAPEDEAPALAAGYMQNWITSGTLTGYKC